MILYNFYSLSFTIFLTIIIRGIAKKYDNYDMKEDRPMLDSAQVLKLLHESDYQNKLKTVPSTLSETVQSHLMPARLRLKNVDVEDTIIPGKLPVKSAL